MNKVIGTSLYRGVQKKNITGEDAFYLTTMGLVPLTIILGFALTSWAWIGVPLIFCMFLLGGSIWYTTPEDYQYKFRSVLEPETRSGKDVVANLEVLLEQYAEEIKCICLPDALFDETWDQIELANITGTNLYDYSKKLTDIKRVCEKIRKENKVAGRSASTDVVDLALEAAKEFK